MPQIFLGRQPIFDRKLRVYAYELLFRTSEHNQAPVVNGYQASCDVIINTFLEIGLDEIVGRHRAFLNLTRDFLIQHDSLPFPKDRLVLEVLEGAAVDRALIDAVGALKDQGYAIALDDFVFTEEWRPLVAMADIIKFDVLALKREGVCRQMDLVANFDAKLLAEKIETPEDFAHFQTLGFDYFQGYFLSKPMVVTGHRPPANRLNTLRLLARLNDPNVGIGELDQLISQDVNLSYKLLRYINSALFALPRKVESIHQAVLFMGLREIKTWTSLLAMSRIEDKPTELFHVALIRAKMCELLANASAQRDADTHFTVGLFSILDALLSLPMEDIVATLPLPETVGVALIRHEGRYGETLRIAIAYEQWDWDQILNAALNSETIQDLYLQSLTWARQVTTY